MADTTVTFKAVADFSKINREAVKAAKSLEGVGDAAQDSSKDAAAAFAAMAGAAKKAGEQAGDGLTKPVERSVDELKRDLKRKQVELSLSTAQASRKLAEFDKKVDRTKAELQLTADDKQAKATLRKLSAERRELKATLDLDEQKARHQVALLRQEVSGREWQATVKAKPDTAEADAAMARAARDRTATIKAEADVGAAEARLDVAARDRKSTIEVDADTGAAVTQMAAAGAATKGFMQQSQLSIGQLIALVGTLGTALIPVAAAAGALAAALVAPLVAAGAGVGALAASVIGNIKQITDAQDELEKAQKEATSAGEQQAAAQKQVASAQDGVVAAVRAREQAETSAARSVSDAERQLAQTRRDAASSVASAQQSLGSTIASSQQSVESAERSLTSAQQQAQAAQESLNDARQAARQRLAEYDMQLRGAALAEKDAKLAIRSAEQALAETLADPKSTQLQIDLARQAVAQAKFNYQQAKKDRTDLRKQAAEDRKAGVKGDEAVKDAKDDLADANQGVKDAEQELRDTRVQAAQDIAQARKEVVQARVDGARQIAAAEQQVKRARVDGAAAVAAASANVVTAQRALKDAQTQAATAATAYAAAQGNVRKQMKLLDGPAAKFTKALDRAKGAWKDFLGATQGPVLKVVNAGLWMFARLLPFLVPIVKSAADGVADLMTQFGKVTQTKGFRDFMGWLAQNAGPMIEAFGEITMNIFGGLFGLFRAFAPLGKKIVGGIVDLTERFRDWGMAANDPNSGVSAFIAYAVKSGPKVLAFIGALAGAFVTLMKGLAPIGDVVLVIVTGLLKFVAAIPPDIITSVVAGVIAFIAALKILTGVMAAVNAVMAANPFVLIALAIAAVVAAFVLLYKKSATFRKMVGYVWEVVKKQVVAAKAVMIVAFNAIKAALTVLGAMFRWLWQNAIRPAFRKIAALGKWLWNKALKPAFALIKTGIRVLADVMRWLWTNIVKPVFSRIADFARWLWNKGVKPAFALLRKGLRALGSAFKWLWDKVVKPVFGWIGDRAKWLWDKALKPAFALMKAGIRAYGKVFRWLYDNVVKPVFNKIGKAIGWTWENVIQPAFDAMKKGFRAVGNGFKWVWEHVLKPPLDAFKKVLDKIKEGLDKVGELKDKAGGILSGAKGAVSGVGGKVKDLFGMASGGYVTRPTAALIGEGGEAEAVLPKSVLQALMEAAGRAGAAMSRPVSAIAGRGRGRKKTTTEDTQAPVKRTGKVVEQTVNRRIVPALTKWDRTVDKRLAPSIDRLERKHATPTINRIGRGMRRFVNNDLARLSAAWRKEFTQTAPDNYRKYRQRVAADTGRMVKNLGNGVDRIRSLFSNLATSLSNIWTNRIKPVLLTMGQFVRDSVAPIFRKGVEAVAGAWNKLKKALAKPVKFVIRVVINDGLIGSINKIADYADVDKMKPVKMPQGLATGGRPLRPRGRVRGPGTETSDSIPARLSTNEHVWSAKEVRGAGGHAGVEELRARARANASRRIDKPTGRIGPHKGTPPHPQQYWLGGGVFPIPGWPVTNPHGTNYYSSWWAGDMAAPEGTPIHAWKEGTVVEVSHNIGSYGNETVINHPDDNWTRYAHQLKQFVDAGDKVTRGQKIGLSDSTGNVTGPHLHFEVGGGKASYEGGTGMGGGPVVKLPPWAQKIANDTTKWAKGLLNAGIESPWGQAIQGTLNTMVKPLAGWASDNLNKGIGAAANFGPGAQGVWKSLMSTNFYSPQQAAGVMGNMQSESGFDPHIVQGGGHAALPTGISSGWGLVQWTPGTKVLPYLKGDGSIGSQIGALTAQLQGKGSSPEGAAGAALRQTKTPESAANVFGLQYERYAGPPQANRATQARAIYEKFKGTHDGGGLLPNNSIALNRSGSDEYVLSNPQYRTWAEMLSQAERGRIGGVGRIGRLGRVGTGPTAGKTVINAPTYTWHVHNPIPEKTSATTLKTLTAVAQRGLNR